MSDKKRRGRKILALCAAACILLSAFIVCFWRMKISGQAKKTVLYSTDLSIDGDFDDYFDLVVMKSLQDIDLKIIVDGNDYGQKQSGVDAIRNLEKIAGGGYRESEVIIGRNHNLKSENDADVSEKLVHILEKAKKEIDIVSVGSLRDVAALYNYNPDLFEDKVGKIWVFAGDAEGTMVETNVSLDEEAFLRIMNSENLDIYWVPCFQRGIWTTGSNASYFTVRHDEVLGSADYRLQKWFLYRFEKSHENFQDYISDNPDINEFMKEGRNLWCAPLFSLINGTMEKYLEMYNQKFGLNDELPCGFSEKKVRLLEGGKITYGEGNRIHVFEVYDYGKYVDFMKFILRSIFNDWSSSG